MCTSHSSSCPGWSPPGTPPQQAPPPQEEASPDQAPPWEQAPSSPVNRMTDRCKNITLSQTSFAGGKKFIVI